MLRSSTILPITQRLEREYSRLLTEAYDLSKKDPKLGQQRYAQADRIGKQLTRLLFEAAA